jgi:hypothetical protein
LLTHFKQMSDIAAASPGHEAPFDGSGSRLLCASVRPAWACRAWAPSISLLEDQTGMATGHTLKLLVLTMTLAGLAGCLSPGATEAPAGVNLDGPWKLDRSASDDPQKTLDKLRSYAARDAARRPTSAVQQTGMGRRGRGAQPPTPTSPDADDLSGVSRPTAGDILTHSPAMHALQSFIQHGDYLTVRQGPEHFVLDYGSFGRSFTPGTHSVVSSEMGVADQVTGWKGKSYVIDVKPQVGAATTEEYALSDDKQHLIVKLHVGGSDLPGFDLKQVYARTNEVLPHSMPTND